MYNTKSAVEASVEKLAGIVGLPVSEVQAAIKAAWKKNEGIDLQSDAGKFKFIALGVIDPDGTFFSGDMYAFAASGEGYCIAHSGKVVFDD
jgi:hypothetical protein